MTRWLDERLNPFAHQVVGISIGIILCSWYLDATSEEIGPVRLLAWLILTAYVWGGIGIWVWRWYLRPMGK